MIPERIMLLVTENCNLNCIYCYEHQKNKRIMTFDTAKSILDEYLPTMKEKNTVIIEVFGGEAFINFDLIKEIDNYIRDNYSDINIIYETTTNGTLVHGEIQNWLSKNKERFAISLSLDGTKYMHDQNRVYIDGKGTFNNIDMDFFRRTWPGCPAKMTISQKTLPYLAEGIKYIDSLGFKCDTTMSVGVDWDAERNVPILVKELSKLVEYYIENPDKQLCTLLNMDLRLILTPIDNDYRFCGAGIDMVCFDTQGDCYPCQGFAPVSIGKQSEYYKNFDTNSFLFNDENPCRKCMFVRLCSNCYAANLQSTGNIQKVDDNLCQLYKLCVMASAKIQAKRIMQKKEKTHDDQLVLKAVSMIQEYLCK